MTQIIDYLTFQSWRAQIELYGMSVENARKLYKDATLYEDVYGKLRTLESEARSHRKESIVCSQIRNAPAIK